MNINKILTSYLTSLLAIIVILLVGYKHIVEIPNTKENIKHIHQKELQILSNIYQAELAKLEKVKDYAIWDDSYNFMLNKNKEYITKNYLKDTLNYLEVEGLFIIDKEGKVIFKKIPKENEVEFKIKTDQISEIIEDKDEKLNGYIKLNNKNYAYSAHNIKRNDLSGDYVGELVFLREINEELIKKLSKNSLLKIKIKNEIEKEKLYYNLSIPVIESELSFVKERAVYDWEGHAFMVFEIEHDFKEKPTVLTPNLIIAMLLMVIVVLLMDYIVRKVVARPSALLSKTLGNMIKEGKIDEVDIKTNIEEYDQILDTFNELATQIKTKNKELKKLSYVDELTKVKNKRYFNENIQNIINQAAQESKYVGMLVSDIDYFKKYNDTLGHVEGDYALRDFANVLTQSVQEKDAHVVRYGGEEFVIILTTENKQEFKQTAENIKDLLKEKAIVHPESLVSDYLTTSTGGIYLKVSEDTKIKPNDLVRLADSNLYNIKEKGRDTYFVREMKIESMIEEVKEE